MGNPAPTLTQIGFPDIVYFAHVLEHRLGRTVADEILRRARRKLNSYHLVLLLAGVTGAVAVYTQLPDGPLRIGATLALPAIGMALGDRSRSRRAALLLDDPDGDGIARLLGHRRVRTILGEHLDSIPAHAVGDHRYLEELRRILALDDDQWGEMVSLSSEYDGSVAELRATVLAL